MVDRVTELASYCGFDIQNANKLVALEERHMKIVPTFIIDSLMR